VITPIFLLISFKNDPMPKKKKIKNIESAVPLKSDPVEEELIGISLAIIQGINIPKYLYI
jgi:hypothetical protein